MNKYEFEVQICGGWCSGSIIIEADNEDAAYDKALEYVGQKLYKAFPTLDIEYSVDFKSKNVTVTNIQRDTDGEDVDLPNEVILEDVANDDRIADMLSDKYGWCVLSYNVKEVVA